MLDLLCNLLFVLSSKNPPTIITDAFQLSRYKCHVCEHSECTDINHDRECEHALICWKSRVRDATGFERVSRGCTTKNEHLPLYCLQNNLNNGPKKRDASGLGVYNMECCTGDYCNNGTFPYLPPLKTEVPDESANEDFVKFWLAILCPVVIVAFIAMLVVLYMRRNFKKRSVDSRIQQDADTYYASDDLLKRSTACGDSTLRVSLTSYNELDMNFILFNSFSRNTSINQ